MGDLWRNWVDAQEEILRWIARSIRGSLGNDNEGSSPCQVAHFTDKQL